MAILIVYLPDGKQEFGINQYTTIGRHPKNSISIPDAMVSGEHCLIAYDDKRKAYVLRDLKSRNGTFVNDHRIQSDIVLKDNDQIFLAGIQCVFSANASLVKDIVEVGEYDVKPYIHTSISTDNKTHFLPEKKIKDTKSLRLDYERLRLVHELQKNISSTENVNEILSKILESVFTFLKCDRGVVLLTDRDGRLSPRAYKSKKQAKRIFVSSTVVDHVRKTREGIISTDASIDSRFQLSHSLRIEGIKSTMAVPILNGDELLGMIIIDSSANANAFSKKDLELINSLASGTGRLIRNTLLHDDLKVSFDRSISTLAAMVDARHPLTAGHSERVAFYSLLVARKMRLSEQDLEILRFAALLHDIGKIAISDRVLLKNGHYSRDDQKEMRTHPDQTRRILEKFHFPKRLKEIPHIASLHHERIDGKGYPFGLTGDKIPFLSKILSVADVFDALTSKRDYPKYALEETLSEEPMPLSKAIMIIKQDSGKHFDPTVVDSFLSCLPHAVERFRGSHFTDEYLEESVEELHDA